MDFKLPNGQKCRMHTDLFQPIEPETCKYTCMGTKLELILSKANGISWPSIEPNENLKSWTTFGIDGKTGSVGGKEMFISKDSPLWATAIKSKNIYLDTRIQDRISKISRLV